MYTGLRSVLLGWKKCTAYQYTVPIDAHVESRSDRAAYDVCSWLGQDRGIRLEFGGL